MSDRPAYVYMIRLQSGTFYVGSTHDVKARYLAHQQGKASRTTRLDPPVALLYTEPHPDFTTARRRETQLKHWTRAKKEALAQGNLEKLKHLAKRRKP